MNGWVSSFSEERITEAGHGKAKAFGHGLASAVIDQWNDERFFRETEPDLEIRLQEVEFGITNWMLALATITGVVDSSPSFHLTWPFIRYKSEVAWLKIGQATLTAILGELYPEIAVGGIENLEGADFAIDPIEVPPLRDALHGRVNFMVNLANDAIGYIIPKSEWDREAPWIYGESEETYGEIVSFGEETGANAASAPSKAFSPGKSHHWKLLPPPLGPSKDPQGRHTILEASVLLGTKPSKTPTSPRPSAPAPTPRAALKGKGRQVQPTLDRQRNAMEEDAPPNEEHGDGPKTARKRMSHGANARIPDQESASDGRSPFVRARPRSSSLTIAATKP